MNDKFVLNFSRKKMKSKDQLHDLGVNVKAMLKKRSYRKRML
jgi:hypothetical protein